MVDTNVIVYLYLDSDQAVEAAHALKMDPDWTSSRLWRSEFRSVLSVYIKRKILSIENALKVVHEAELFMKEKEYEPSSSEILRLASASNCSAYDCEFVALAHAFNAPLVTCDERLLKAFPSVAVSLKTFATLLNETIGL